MFSIFNVQSKSYNEDEEPNGTLSTRNISNSSFKKQQPTTESISTLTLSLTLLSKYS